MNEKEIKFIDLFGGIGGFRLGLEKASEISTNSKLRTRCSKRSSKSFVEGARQFTSSHHYFRCIWYCDIDKYAVKTYNKNFQENYEPTDIRTADIKDIPDFDLLCAGFPCQSFSIAGKREGFQDTRGSLFFEICRIAQAKRPRMLFLENVKGLLSHGNGETYQVILESLDELGYDVEWQVLNSKNFGVPQNRERVFIVGHLRGTGGQQVFPLKERNGVFEQKDERKQEGGKGIQSTISPTIDARYGALRNVGEPYIISRPHGFNKGNIGENVNIRFSTIQNELVIYDGHHKKFTKEMGTLTGRENRKDTNWLIGKNINNIRRLTPVECERLQSFPDGWTGGVSDTQRYKQLGNAVTVNVIEAIGIEILGV